LRDTETCSVVATRARGGEIVRTTLFFSFQRSEARLCNVVLLCGGKPGNIVMPRRGCWHRDDERCGSLVCACLCWLSRLWLTSDSCRPGPVISFMPVRGGNVCAPSCEWWWLELCGRKVVLRVLDASDGTTFCCGCLLRASGWFPWGCCAALLSRPGCGCYRCSRHLYRWSTNGISAMGFMVIGSPSPLCDVL